MQPPRKEEKKPSATRKARLVWGAANRSPQPTPDPGYHSARRRGWPRKGPCARSAATPPPPALNYSLSGETCTLGSLHSCRLPHRWLLRRLSDHPAPCKRPAARGGWIGVKSAAMANLFSFPFPPGVIRSQDVQPSEEEEEEETFIWRGKSKAPSQPPCNNKTNICKIKKGVIPSSRFLLFRLPPCCCCCSSEKRDSGCRGSSGEGKGELMQGSCSGRQE